MNVMCDVCLFYEISLLIGGIKIHFSETYSYLICMQQCAVAGPILKVCCPLKIKNLSYFILINRFPPIYLPINNIPNSKSDITTILVEYDVLGERYVDTGY